MQALVWQKRYLVVLLAGGGASSLHLGLEPVFTVTRDPGLKPAARCGIIVIKGVNFRDIRS